MLDYFQWVVETTKKEKTKQIYTGKLEAYEKNRTQCDKLPVFESFYLKDLIELARYRKLFIVGEAVNNLRNMVMHAHDLVYLHDATRNDYIYNFATFEVYFLIR